MAVRYLNWDDAISPSVREAMMSATATLHEALGAPTDTGELQPPCREAALTLATTEFEAGQHRDTLTQGQDDTVVQQEGGGQFKGATKGAARALQEGPVNSVPASAGTVEVTSAGAHDLQGPPQVAAAAQYSLVLATDCLYEAPMAYGVAATVKRHLAVHGRCLICNAVRFQDLHELLLQRLAAEGLKVQIQPIENIEKRAWEFGALGARTDYEGGFVVMYIEQEGAAAAGGGWQGRYTLFN